MNELVYLMKKYFFLMIFLLLFMLGIDEWQLSRIQADVRNTLETAEQAAIIRALDVHTETNEVDSFVFAGGIGFDGMGFHEEAAKNAFLEEVKRGLHLEGSINNLTPQKSWLKEFSIDYLSIEMVDNYPRVTAGVTAKTKLMAAPLIDYEIEYIKAELGDRHTIIWK